MSKRHIDKKFKNPETKKIDADSRQVDKVLSKIVDKIEDLPEELQDLIPPEAKEEISNIFGGMGLAEMTSGFMDFFKTISRSVAVNDATLNAMSDNMTIFNTKLYEIKKNQETLYDRFEIIIHYLRK